MQKFRGSNSFTKEVTKELISRNIFFGEREFLVSMVFLAEWIFFLEIYSYTFREKFRESNCLTKVITEYVHIWFDEIFLELKQYS